jgi:hypothetical protein
MKPTGLEGEAEALKAIKANRTPRYVELDALERYVETTQYEGRPHWFDDTVPLWERAPIIAYPIVQTAIASNIDMLLGEQSWPTITSFSHLNDDEELEDEELSELLEWVDRGLGEVVEKSRLKAAARESYAQAQGARTAVAIVGLRNGTPFVDTVRAKWCTPQLDVDGSVIALEIRYPYLDREYDKRSNKWRAVAKLYRRVIDDQSDTTFLPQDARPDGVQPESWTKDPRMTVRHGLGFCPVVWYAYRRGCSTVNDIDGQALHEHCTDEIQAHDFAVSQRHTAALFMLPQICEFGVPAGYNPTETGQMPDMVAASRVDEFGNAQSAGGYIGSRKTGSARKKGPGYVWQYPDKQSCDVKVVGPDPAALDAIDKHASDIRAKIAESLQVVFLDPEHVKFAASMSGKALRTLRERQYAHCDQDRDDFGNGWLLPVMKMVLRVTQKVGVAAVRLKFAPQLFDALQRLATRTTEKSESGEDYQRGRSTESVSDGFEIPDIELKWPDHFMSAPQDELFTVQAVAAAQAEVPQKYRLQKLAPIFGIKNPDIVLKELAEEKAAAQAHEVEMQAQLAATLRDGNPGPAQGAGKVGGKKPPPSGSGSGAGPAVAAKASS